MKKILSIVLAVFIAVFAIPVNNVSALEEKQTVPDFSSRGLGEEGYVYKDSYFDDDATVYNPSLATLSLYASLAYGDYWKWVSGSEVKHDLDIEFLTNCGFDNLVYNDAYGDPTLLDGKDEVGVWNEDSFGVLLASKVVNEGLANEYTLITVITRGDRSDAGREMASEVTAGKSGDVQGYVEAANILITALANYVNSLSPSGNFKVWLTGYERGAATVNVAAAKIDDKGSIGNYLIGKENVFAYTFDSGNTTTSSTAKTNYTNIHNIVNPNKLTTYLYPAEWGFTRYGTDENVIGVYKSGDATGAYQYIAGRVNAIANMDAYKYYSQAFQGYDLTTKNLKEIAIWNTNWEIQNWKYYQKRIFAETDLTYNEMLQQLVTKTAKAVGSRKIYVQNYQNILRMVCSSFGDGDVGPGEFFDIFCDKLKENFGALSAAAILKDLVNYNKVFTQIVKDSLAEADMKEEELTQLSSALLTLSPILNHTIWALLAENGSEEIVSLIYSLDTVLAYSANDEEYLLAWLQSQDPNYADTTEIETVKADLNGGIVDSDITVSQKSTTTKTGKLKIKKTTYTVTIDTNGKNVKSVQYRTSDLAAYKDGTTYSSSLKIKKLYIKIIDINGKASYWYYNGSTLTKQ